MELPIDQSFYALKSLKDFSEEISKNTLKKFQIGRADLEERLQDATFKKLYDTCFVEEDFSNLPLLSGAPTKSSNQGCFRRCHR